MSMTKIKKYIANLKKERGEEVSADKDRVIEVLLGMIEDDKAEPQHKLTAIDKLSRLQGWMKSDTQIEINNNSVEKVSDEELQRRMDEIMNANSMNLQ